MTGIVKRCGATGCRNYVQSGLCPPCQRRKNKTYGRPHRATRQQIMSHNGWACHYCGQPVTLADDIAHPTPTQTLTPTQAHRAPRVPAHRNCHNNNAPHRH